MSMSDIKFKEEILRRSEKEKRKIKRKKRIILSVIPVVLVTGLALMLNLSGMFNVRSDEEKMNTTPTSDALCEEESFLYSDGAAAGKSEDSFNTAKKTVISVSYRDVASTILDENKIAKIIKIIDEMEQTQYNYVTDNSLTAFEESVEPQYKISIDNKDYFIINNTFTNSNREILCSDSQKINKLIILIK